MSLERERIITKEEQKVRELTRGQLHDNFKYLQYLIDQKKITDPQAARKAILNWLSEKIGNDPEITKIESDIKEPTRIWQWAGFEIGNFVKQLNLSGKKVPPKGEMVHIKNIDYEGIHDLQDIRAYLFQEIDEFVSSTKLFRLNKITRNAIRQICREELIKMDANKSDLPRILAKDDWDGLIEETLREYEKKMP